MSSSVSLACGGRDVLFLRALGGLLPPLLTALRESGLDDAGTLLNYPLDLEDKGDESRQAPSGTASTGHRPLLAMTICTTPLMEATVSSTRTTVATPASAGGTVDSVIDVGGDPRTDQFVPSGGEVKTDQFVPSGGEVKTDQFVPSGGEVKTDHIPFSVQMAGVSEEIADSPRSEGLATQTAISATVSPALDPDVALTLGSELRDGLPSYQEDPELRDEFPSSQLASDPVHFDGFPSSAELPEDRDGFPSSDYLDSTLGVKSTRFTPNFHIAENSERLRESDFGVQIVPASRSPSELSAHQMGLSLAGTSRLKIEPIGVDPISTRAIGEPVQLSISDRALLRKYKSSEQVQEISRQGETYKEITAGVPRVDGHPPEPSLSLYERMLLLFLGWKPRLRILLLCLLLLPFHFRLKV